MLGVKIVLLSDKQKIGESRRCELNTVTLFYY